MVASRGSGSRKKNLPEGLYEFFFDLYSSTCQCVAPGTLLRKHTFYPSVHVSEFPLFFFLYLSLSLSSFFSLFCSLSFFLYFFPSVSFSFFFLFLAFRRARQHVKWYVIATLKLFQTTIVKSVRSCRNFFVSVSTTKSKIQANVESRSLPPALFRKSVSDASANERSKSDNLH